jgi:hypothetical protein
MPSKGLKPAIARSLARDALAAADAVAQQAGLPPAALAPRPPLPTPPQEAPVESEELVQVNIRVRRSLGDQLADRARTEGTTQKVLVCRALAAAGFDVHPEDLRPMPPPRRRGSS